MEYKKGQEDIIKRATVINERAENINKQFVKVQVRKGNAGIATPKNIIEIKVNKQISDNSMEMLERVKALNARISKKRVPFSQISNQTK
ncbi:hypothetical protein ACSS6N_15065 [Peribacillus frigoritolerans]|uniref:hypothetical protein n=1 Tax=Peribacillus frigoritolerans TaxID=450367 RepID=UPI003F843DA9